MTVATKPKFKTIRLFEQTSGANPDVDREAGIIRNVKVLGRVSRNGGRKYSDKACDDACRLLEGIEVNIDHDRTEKGSERSFLSGIGVIKGLHKRPDGVYARELHVKKSHPNADLLFESAERFPGKFGLSINARGYHNSQTNTVESLHDASSVDIVGRPATTSGLYESVNTSRAKTVKITIKGLVESLSDALPTAKPMKTRLKKILESGGGDSAMMGAPVDMTDPDAGSADPDPMEQINEAFGQSIMAVVNNDAIKLADKIDQITKILTLQDELMNGSSGGSDGDGSGGKKSIPVTEDEGGDQDMQESLKPVIEAIGKLTTLVESSNASQKQDSMRILLMESNIEAGPEKIAALVGAADDNARKLLLESWPKRMPSAGFGTTQKPAMQARLQQLHESDSGTGALPEFKSGKAFLQTVRQR